MFTPPPDEQAEEIVRRSKARRQIITLLVIVAVCAATAWIWAWPAKADTVTNSEGVTVSQEYGELTIEAAPQCQQWVAGWVSVPASCNPKPLPAIVRKCAGSAVVGALMAYLSGGTSILFGAGAGLAGCIPWAGND